MLVNVYFENTSEVKIYSLAFTLFYLCIASIFAVSGDLLSMLGINYKLQGGSLLHKLHPSFYFIVLASLALLLYRDGISVFKSVFYKKEIFYCLFICLFVLIYGYFVLANSLAPFIVAWIPPIILLAFLIELNKGQRVALSYLVHFILFLNSFVGLYEFLTGSAVIPVSLIDYDSGEAFDVEEWEMWRARGLLGHPLTSTLVSACVLVYSFSRILFSKSVTWIEYFSFFHSLLSLPAFGGRASIAIAILFVFIMSVYKTYRFIKGEEVSKSGLVFVHFILFSLPFAFFLVYLLGYFDPLISRIEDDNGSAETRIKALYILMDSSFLELLFGDIYKSLFTKQLLYGTSLGIEIFWVGLILKYGLLVSALLLYILYQLVRITVVKTGCGALWLFSVYFLALSSGVGLIAKTVSLSLIVCLPFCYSFGLYPDDE